MPAPTFTIEEVESREMEVSIDNPTQELVFKVTGSFDDAIIRTQTEAALTPTIVQTSPFFGTRTLSIQNYRLKHLGNGIWEGRAKYARRQPRQTGDVVMSFDGTGGTAHIAVSKDTPGSFARSGPMSPPVATSAVQVLGGMLPAGNIYYVVTAVGPVGETLKSNQVTTNVIAAGTFSVVVTWAAVANATSYKIYRSAVTNTYTSPCLLGTATGLSWNDPGNHPLQVGAPPASVIAAPTPPDFKNAIGVTNDAVEGCDITIPVFKFKFDYYPAVDLMTDDYIIALMQMTGKVNDAVWKGFQPGEVLFLGPTGQPRGLDDWEIAMQFVASPNKTDLKVGDIKNIVKGGHNYLWVRFCDAVGGSNIIKIPEFAFVEEVYEEGSFEDLGIGS